MSIHKMTVTRDDAEYTLTFGYRPGRPAVMHLRNGDPGYPADPPEIEFVSVEPLPAQEPERMEMLCWARDWLDEGGWEEALEVVEVDEQREAFNDMRREP